MTQKSKMLIAYDGTEYSGWQIQPGETLTIQELIQNSLSTLIREKINIVGSGRTDAGVHALGQVAHFRSTKEFDHDAILFRLNSMLPNAIRILSLEAADEDFHAQKSAKSKTYHYHLWLEDVVDPFRRLYVHQCRNRIDLELLKAAANEFVGTHNFSSFTNSATKGSAGRNPVRTIHEIRIVPQVGGVRLEFKGNGFLYKMVRNIVGSLIQIGSGRRPIEEIQELFKAKDRRLAASGAPARGLFLVCVDYSLDSKESKPRIV
jgi:tRNA pseudouridine38-40 synthase